MEGKIYESRSVEACIIYNFKKPLLLQSINRQQLNRIGLIKRHRTLEKLILEARVESRRREIDQQEDEHRI